MALNFELIGTPIAHSLSPCMHNAMYAAAGLDWAYGSEDCKNEYSARDEIAKVFRGELFGMNITMPYKPLALRSADEVDSSARVAGGANVLVHCRGSQADGGLRAFNTDGAGCAGAVARLGGISLEGTRVAVCGTGPTSCAIAHAFALRGASQVYLFSREAAKAASSLAIIESCLEGARCELIGAAYSQAAEIVPTLDVLVDATPRGMQPGDEPIVNPALFHEGQVVYDVVYGHGLTALVAGARAAGAQAFDGLHMLVEQAALSVEIWAEAAGVELVVDREIMLAAALEETERREREDG